MAEKRYRWVKIANGQGEISFGENKMIEIVVDEKKICIAETISGLRACSSRCPHAGGNMSQGKVDKNANIICPVHGYMFSLDSGRDKGGEGYFLKIYPVKENEEGVFIGLEETFLQDK